jgi:hypothetical protein
LRFSDHRTGDGEAFYDEACRHGWEGLIAKRAGSTYRLDANHQRSRSHSRFYTAAGGALIRMLSVNANIYDLPIAG